MSITQLAILQLLAPIGLLVWLAFGRPASRAIALLRMLLTGSYLAAVGLAGLWLALPAHLPLIYIAIFIIALVIRWKPIRTLSMWPTERRGWVGFGIHLVLCCLTTGLMIQALSGRRPPEGPVVELAFPLRDGTYLVANGGSNGLVSSHLATLTRERSRPYRGQSHGVDLVKLGPWGFRARGVAPQDPAAYTIFGDPVHAPCSGTVVEATDGLVDLPPPQVDRENFAGNHVILDCGDVWVLLAHLQRSSVRARAREKVEKGRVLGRVGNTGNTIEPHLHIHAQRPGTPEAPLGGEPVPIRFDGHYLYRNALIFTD